MESSVPGGGGFRWWCRMTGEEGTEDKIFQIQLPLRNFWVMHDATRKMHGHISVITLFVIRAKQSSIRGANSSAVDRDWGNLSILWKHYVKTAHNFAEAMWLLRIKTSITTSLNLKSNATSETFHTIVSSFLAPVAHALELGLILSHYFMISLTWHMKFRSKRSSVHDCIFLCFWRLSAQPVSGTCYMWLLSL